jgi:hypothetical protein
MAVFSGNIDSLQKLKHSESDAGNKSFSIKQFHSKINNEKEKCEQSKQSSARRYVEILTQRFPEGMPSAHRGIRKVRKEIF